MVKKSGYKIIWDGIAIEQLKEYLEYVSQQSPAAPSIIKNGILDKLRSVKKNPLICEPDKLNDRDDNAYRAFIVYSYRITYYG